MIKYVGYCYLCENKNNIGHQCGGVGKSSFSHLFQNYDYW